MATNWEKVVSQDSFDDMNSKVGNSTDDETKATLFGKIAKVFQSVSSGKSKIATAITGKGIATLGSDTFAKMAGNINLIKMVVSGDAGKILAGQAINGISGTATNDANAVAGNMLSGKTGYVKGLKVSGNIPSKTAQTFTPSTVNQTIAANQFLSGAQTIAGSGNLLAGNIKSGVNLFGVVGNVVAQDVRTGTVTTPSVTYTDHYSVVELGGKPRVVILYGARTTNGIAVNSLAISSPINVAAKPGDEYGETPLAGIIDTGFKVWAGGYSKSLTVQYWALMS